MAMPSNGLSEMTTTYFDSLPEYLLSEMVGRSNSYELISRYSKYLNDDLKRLADRVESIQDEERLFYIGLNHNLLDLVYNNINEERLSIAFYYFAEHGYNSEFIELAIRYNFVDLFQYLCTAIDSDNLEIVEFIFERASDDILEFYFESDYLTETFYNAMEASLPLVEYYLDNELVRIENVDISHAITSNRLEVVKYLVERGAYVEEDVIYEIESMVEEDERYIPLLEYLRENV